MGSSFGAYYTVTAWSCYLACRYRTKQLYTAFVKKNTALIKIFCSVFDKKCATLLWFASGFVREVTFMVCLWICTGSDFYGLPLDLCGK